MLLNPINKQASVNDAEFKRKLRENQNLDLGEFLPQYYDYRELDALKNSVYEYNRSHRTPVQQRLFNVGENIQLAGIGSAGLGFVASPFTLKYGLLGMGAGASAAYLGSKLKRATTPDKYKSWLDTTLTESSDAHDNAVRKIIDAPKFRDDFDNAYLAEMNKLRANNPKYDEDEALNEASAHVDYDRLLIKHKVPRKVVVVGNIPEELRPLYEKYLKGNSGVKKHTAI